MGRSRLGLQRGGDALDHDFVGHIVFGVDRAELRLQGAARAGAMIGRYGG